MLGVWRNALSIFLLAIFLLIVSLLTETREKKALLDGKAPSDLGVDSAVEPPLRSKFRIAGWVGIGSLQRTRSTVDAASTQKQSTDQGLLKFVDEAAAQTTGPDSDSAKAPVEESKESPQEATPTTPAKSQPRSAVKTKVPDSRSRASSPEKSATPVDNSQEGTTPAEKSPSILQMLEGRETELMIAAGIAATFFFIGWISGGYYYLRRDRRRRTKIRF